MAADRIRLRNILALAAAGLVSGYAHPVTAQCRFDLHPVVQGYTMKIVLSAQGGRGNIVNNFCYAWDEGCQFPEDSPIEHLDEMGIWVGALVDVGPPGQPRLEKRVTQTTYDPDSALPGLLFETSPCNPDTPWHRRSSLQDSTAISENDYISEYSDTTPVRGHRPLGIKIMETSHAWANAVRDLVLPFDCVLTNIGKNRLKSLWIGLRISPYVSPIELPPEDVVGYWPELLTAYSTNPVLRLSPIGFTILFFPRHISELKYYYQWWERGVDSNDQASTWDASRYDLMSGAALNPNQPLMRDQPLSEPTWAELLVSFGPIDSCNPGDTLKFSFAIVGGLSLKYGPENLHDNAAKVQTLFSRGYKPPVVLPAPPLSIETGFKKVTLHWGWNGQGVNPEDVWDDANTVAEFYPPDHWRRAKPPPGHTKGGRVFAGYRLYRSEDPAGTANSFTLLRQWDVKDSVGPAWGYQTGIETTFVDTNLSFGKVYWYSVTSYGIPDMHVIDYVDWDGTVKQETLSTPSAETSVLAARKRVKLPFSVSTERGKVMVVPNPYRGDANYTYEGGGWEGRASQWTEDKRLIKFIHLPTKCTIRIFTLAGEIVTTIQHEDPTRGEHDWNLISESGRAIASGLYIFTVESDYGKQTGKFVIIR